MQFYHLAATLYAVMAVLFALATMVEGCVLRPGFDRHRVLGLVASAVWPLTLVAIWMAAGRAMARKRRGLAPFETGFYPPRQPGRDGRYARITS